jgi:cation diffusion facilitator CzcD-associated flavoprotein CzcO
MMEARGKMKAAVVGAGAAGLAAAKQLRDDGHLVKVFEASNDVGGVWQYTPEVEAHPMGNPVDTRIHSSIYASLRTNLPREVMQFDAMPFTEEFDARRFPHHSAVFQYLSKFADTYQLRPLISFGRKVTRLQPSKPVRTSPAGDDTGGGGGGVPRGVERNATMSWTLEHAAAEGLKGGGEGGAVEREEFDVVMVCNGHYSEPSSPVFEGAEFWPGRMSHSHNYRQPEIFAGQRVVVVGASASGEDIARDISSTAAQVV